MAILALAVGLRVLAWQRATMMFNDGPNFLWQAQRLLEGDWLAAASHPYHPLYGALTALASLVTDDLLTAAVAVSIGSGLIICVAAYALARAALPDVPGVGPAAALTAALTTRMLDVTADVQADGLFAALSLLALWSVVRLPVGQRWSARAAFTGLLIGLTFLTRAEGLYLLMAPALWVLGGTAGTFGRRAGAGLVLMLALGLTLLPHLLALHEVTGQWCLSLKHSLRNVGLGPDGAPWQAPSDSPMGWPMVPSLPETVESAAPVQVQGQPPRQGALGPNLRGFGLALAVQAPATLAPPGLVSALNASLIRFIGAARLEFLLLVLPGLMLLRHMRPRLLAGLLVLVLGWILVAAVQVHRSHFLVNRHMILPIALLLPVAGAGVCVLWHKNRWCRALATVALLVGAVAGTRAERSQHEPLLEALTWVRAHSEPGQAFLTHRQRNGWYAQRVAITAQLPVAEAPLRNRLAQHSVSHLVYAVEDVQRYAPQWLVDQQILEVARFGEGEQTVAVYEPRFSPR